MTRVGGTFGGGTQGFALVETIVAAAVVAGMFGVVLESVISTARATRMVEDRRLATLVAQSQLTATAASASAGLLDTNGETNGVVWHVSIAPFAGRYAQPRIEQITAAAGSGVDGKPLVVLRSLKLAR